MKKQNLVRISLFALILGAVVCFGLLEYGGPYMEKARESEAKTQLSSFATAANAFYAAYNEYTPDYKSIGYYPEGKLRGKMYFSAEQLPIDVAAKVPESEKPYFAKDSYRVIYVMGSGEEMKVFAVDNKKVIRRVTLTTQDSSRAPASVE